MIIQSGLNYYWILTPLIHFDINYLFNKRLLSSFRHFVNFYKNKLCLGHKIMIYKLGGLFPETDTNSNGMVQGYQNGAFLKYLKKSKILFKFRVLVVSSICQFVTLESIFWRKRIKDMRSVGNKIENIPNMAF